MNAFKAPLAALILALAACFSLVSASAAQAPPPAEAYARNPEMRFPRISPDGTKLAWIDNRDGQQSVIIGRFGDGSFAVEKRITVNGLKTRGLRWAGETHVLLATSDTRNLQDSGQVRFIGSRIREFFRTYAINIETAGVKQLLENDRTLWVNVSLSVISSAHYKKPGHVLMPANVGNVSETGSRLADTEISYDLLEVNLDTGRRTRTVAFGEPNTSYWITDDEGPIAQVAYESVSDHFMVLAKDGKRWKSIIDFYSELPEIGVQGYYQNPQQPVITVKEGGQRRLKTLNAQGELVELYAAPDGLDVSFTSIDPYTGEVIGAGYTGEKTTYVYFDDDLAALFDQVLSSMPNSTVWLSSWSRDRSRFIVGVERGVRPTEYYLLDRNAGQLSKLGDQFPELSAEWIGEMRSISYQARDGLRIPAYLTLPPNRAAENLPLVLLPHGGPEARDGWGFDWLSQFIASRGYAVLQPNFRGSSGYGESFARAGYGEWGKAMQDDLTDGVRHLVDQGIADPNKVCIFGWSYGGYAALAGATLTPELYQCAIAGAPVSDLPAMLNFVENNSGRQGTSVAYWTRNMLDEGRLSAGDLAEVSPARLASNVQAPILMIHGTNDTVVPFFQTETMENALKRAGKPYKVVTLDFADHWLSGGTPEEVKLTVLKEVEAFLAQNLN